MKTVIRTTIAAAALAMVCVAAQAQDWEYAGHTAMEAGAVRAAMREEAFWLCDYIATSRGAQFAPMDECVQVTDELKHAKFAGDYERMVAWWRERKPFEHHRLRLVDELK